MQVIISSSEKRPQFTRAGLYEFTLKRMASSKEKLRESFEESITLLLETENNAEILIIPKEYGLEGEDWIVERAEIVTNEEEYVLDHITLIIDCKFPQICEKIYNEKINSKILEMTRRGERVPCGIYKEGTTDISYVSSKNRVTMGLLLSEEIFQVDESSGELAYERFANNFMHDLLEMWVREATEHKYKPILIIQHNQGEMIVVELSPWKSSKELLEELGSRIKQECIAVKRILGNKLLKSSEIELSKVIEVASAVGLNGFDPLTVQDYILLFVIGKDFKLQGTYEKCLIVNLLPHVPDNIGEFPDLKWYSIGKEGHSRQSSRTNEPLDTEKRRFPLDTLAFIPVVTRQREAQRPFEFQWCRSFHNQLVNRSTKNKLEEILSLIMIPAKEPPYHRIILDSAKNEKLDDEELRIAGFYHFCEQMLKVMHIETHIIQNPVDQLGISLSTLTASQFAWQELKRREEEIIIRQNMLNELKHENVAAPKIIKDSIEGVMPLTQNSDLSLIAAMMQNPLIGVLLKNRRWHLTIYKNVLIGSDAVDWFCKFFEDINNREEAVVLGQSLMDKGVISHVLSGHKFLDGFYYYQFSPDYKSGGKFVRESMVLEPNTLAKSLEEMKQSSRVPMVKNLSHSDGDHIIELHYDTVQNPAICFHFALKWSSKEGNAPKEVMDIFEALKIKSQLCGFELVPEYFDKSIEEELESVENEEWLFKNGFYLDVEANKDYPPEERMTKSFNRDPANFTRYINQSGSGWVLVEKNEESGKPLYKWVPNLSSERDDKPLKNN